MTCTELARISCPYCGETFETVIDPSAPMPQDYVEDCYVCCQPIEFHVTEDSAGEIVVTVRRDDES